MNLIEMDWLKVPKGVLYIMLINLDPPSISSFSKVCKRFKETIYGENSEGFWRIIYSRRYKIDFPLERNYKYKKNLISGSFLTNLIR